MVFHRSRYFSNAPSALPRPAPQGLGATPRIMESLLGVYRDAAFPGSTAVAALLPEEEVEIGVVVEV